MGPIFFAHKKQAISSPSTEQSTNDGGREASDSEGVMRSDEWSGADHRASGPLPDSLSSKRRHRRQ